MGVAGTLVTSPSRNLQDVNSNSEAQSSLQDSGQDAQAEHERAFGGPVLPSALGALPHPFLECLFGCDNPSSPSLPVTSAWPLTVRAFRPRALKHPMPQLTSLSE